MLPDNDAFEIQNTVDPEDFKCCAKIMAESEPWITLGISYPDCLTAFEGPCKVVAILKKEQTIIGFVIMQTCGSFKGYIQTLAVDKAFRGRGYGTVLLHFCEEKILHYSPNIFICVSSFNTSALQLYLKFGFEQVGQLSNFVKEGYTELLLRKTVGPLNGYRYQDKF